MSPWVQSARACGETGTPEPLTLKKESCTSLAVEDLVEVF